MQQQKRQNKVDIQSAYCAKKMWAMQEEAIIQQEKIIESFLWKFIIVNGLCNILLMSTTMSTVLYLMVSMCQ